MQSQAWKNLEKLVAEKLFGTRVSRGADFGKKCVDVKVRYFKRLKIDAKYRTRWGHHTFLEEVAAKYCKKGDIPVLVTKTHNQRGAVVCVYLNDFSEIIELALCELKRRYRDKEPTA